jgi:hypothetical protein
MLNCSLRFIQRKIETQLTTCRGRRSPLSRLRSGSTPKTKFKVVLMPRSECERFFAIDETGSYIGTEEQRTWTEQELEDRYGECKAALPAAPMKYQSPEKVTGGYELSLRALQRLAFVTKLIGHSCSGTGQLFGFLSFSIV